MTSLAMSSTYDLASRWTQVLRSFSPRAIAKRIGASPRTVENWQDGANGPTWKHTVAMLNDDVLASKLLEAAGRADLAKQHELATLNRRIDALKAEERLHKEEAHGIRQGLEMGRPRGSVDSGSTQRLRDPLAKDRGVVSRSTD